MLQGHKHLSMKDLILDNRSNSSKEGIRYIVAKDTRIVVYNCILSFIIRPLKT